MFKRKTLLISLAFLLLVGLAGVSVALAHSSAGYRAGSWQVAASHDGSFMPYLDDRYNFTCA